MVGNGLAAAVADDKDIVSLLEKLDEEDFCHLLRSINTIERHRDLCYLTDRIDRLRPAVPSKRASLPRPRQRNTRRTRPRGAVSRKIAGPSQAAEAKTQCEEDHADENCSGINVEPAYEQPQSLSPELQVDTALKDLEEITNSIDGDLAQFINLMR